ncbi:MAG TPA: hypothetical protein VGO56_06415 [Pyrinomonadaceae bacterium]|jgi:hypothetical protein|nr:hypothetical protein [Pyrinomonadaceae bacterium]
MAIRQNGNGHGRLHVTETPDVSHIRNIDVTHEASDVSVVGIATFVGGLTILCGLVFVLMWGMFRFLNAQETEKEPQAGPMAMTEQERLPPAPRLQAAKGFGVKLENGESVNLELREPEAEYRLLREQWAQRLNCKSGDGVVTTNCVPIDVAIEKLIQSGVPVRSEKSWGSADAPAPTAWSSGRVAGEGRQKQ